MRWASKVMTVENSFDSMNSQIITYLRLTRDCWMCGRRSKLSVLVRNDGGVAAKCLDDTIYMVAGKKNGPGVPRAKTIEGYVQMIHPRDDLLLMRLRIGRIRIRVVRVKLGL